MAVLTRSGCLLQGTPELKKQLRVRAIVNDDYGFPPPPFNCYRTGTQGRICVPQFFPIGEAVTEDKRPEPARADIRFQGKLKSSTGQVDAHRAACEKGHGLLSLPCGFGKTVLALAISAHFKLRTMIIVHKEFLAQQWRERIEQFCPGAKVGIVQQNKKEVEGCDYVIAMLQSLSMKEYVFSDFETVGVLIVDECHHICARTFSQALFKVVPRHVFGLSATPERKDGLTKLLTWFIGPTAFSVERKAQRGVEVFPITFNDALFRTAPPVTRNGQLSLVGMITALCECRARNQMLCRLIKRASAGTRKLLVLSDRRLHCEMLHQAFKSIGGLYMGGMKQKDLQASSECKIIFATYSQAHEGLDIPTLDTVILATPKSDIVQSIGRIMRGKAENNPHIYDVRDEWGGVFPAMYYKRLKVYKSGGYTIIPDGKQTDPAVADDTAEFRKKCMIKI